jgi:phosphoserine phosphatase RsbU/P
MKEENINEIKSIDGKPINILYIEDDEGLAYLIQNKLALKGYLVDIARDGKEGLEICRKGSYNVLAIDYEIPVYNGLEVVSILSSEGDLSPTIMIIGAGNENLAVEAMKSGVDDYLVKDIEGRYIEMLPSVISRVLKQQQLINEKRAIEEERERLIIEFQEALEKVRTLSGLLPICAHCKKIRDDNGYWNQIEIYFRDHSEIGFTHGICPDCVKKFFFCRSGKTKKD